MRCLLLGAALVACVSQAWAVRVAGGVPQVAATKTRIMTAAGVRVRAEPQAGAAEAGRLQLGTVVRELEQSASKEKVGALEDYWYRVSAPGGVEGWVFGALTAPFDPARRAEIYLSLARTRLNVESTNFADRTELFSFLDRAVREKMRGDAPAELELLRLLALQKSLAAVPFEKQAEPPYQPWIKAQDEAIVYSEPAGQWYVRAELFWNLEQKYHAIPIAERIAWEASQIPLPGECEGYLPCHLGNEAETVGEYLKRYPRGAHAAQALGSISELLAHVLEDFKNSDPVYTVSKEDRASFQKQVAALRAVVARVANPKAPVAVKQLDVVARHFR